jgi:hypothetical protein
MNALALATLLLSGLACRVDQQLGSLGNDGPSPTDRDSGDPGEQSPRITCGSSDCVITTSGGLADCSGAQTCDVTCKGDCSVNCRAVPCRVNCAPGARCEVICTQGPAASCPTAGISTCNGGRC